MPSNPDTTLSGFRTYTLTLHGELDAEFASTFCPPETTFARDGKTLRLASRVADILEGANSSDPRYLAVYNGALYFQADGGDGAGRELWRYISP